MQTLTTFLGWCAIINIGFILVAMLILSVFREGLAGLNSKLFDVTKEDAKITMFRVFQQYRFAVIMLNLVPYIVLKIMS